MTIMFLNVLFETFQDIGRCYTSKCVFVRVFMYDIYIYVCIHGFRKIRTDMIVPLDDGY